ncbi:response regulator [bacterium]|nr:response regulator [bacterium]
MNIRKVLYAEDELSNRKIMQIKLKKMDIECDLAENGQAAIDMFKQNSYGLILLDLYMPIMDGDEAARHIRKIDPAIPIIAITSDDDRTNELKKCGFDHVFIKPIHDSKYMDIIKGYLQ